MTAVEQTEGHTPTARGRCSCGVTGDTWQIAAHIREMRDQDAEETS